VADLPEELDPEGRIVLARIYLPAPIPLVSGIMEAVADAYPESTLGRSPDGRSGREIVLVVQAPGSDDG